MRFPAARSGSASAWNPAFPAYYPLCGQQRTEPPGSGWPPPTGIVGRRVGRHHRGEGGGGVMVLSGPLGGGQRAGEVVQRRPPPRVRDGQEAAREFQQQALPPGQLERRLAAQAREEVLDLDPQRLCRPPELAGGEPVDAPLVFSGLLV